MNENEIENKLREFIIETFLFGQDFGLKSSDSLLKKGVIDSTGIMELIDFIEHTFRVTIGDEEILPENLDSLDHATAFIFRKRKD
jgi:acyl carrier protein